MVRDSQGPGAELDIAEFMSAVGGTAVSLWGVAPIAPVHLGLDRLVVAQKQLVRDGWHHVVLLADMHGMMSHGLSFSDLAARSLYWEHYLRFGCGLDATYIRGSDFQMSREYVEQLYVLTSQLTTSTLKDALPMAVREQKRQSGTHYVGDFIYVLTQCLDVCYLPVDVVLADEGQRKVYEIFDSTRDCLRQNKAKLSTLMGLMHTSLERPDPPHFRYLPTARDIMGRPVSQSSAHDRISVHETEATLSDKVRRMYAPPQNQQTKPGTTHALLDCFQFSVFPWLESVAVRTEDGSEKSYSTFGSLKSDYERGRLWPDACKDALGAALWERISAVQNTWDEGITGWVDQKKATGVE